MDLEAVVLRHTTRARPILCPEIELYLVTPECPLWRATERDLAELGIVEPYWAFCWPGGQALGRFILDHPEIVRGKRVLDFGAGCGVAAIAAMRSGAASACAADLDPLAAAASRVNARINGVDLDTTTRDLLGSPTGSLAGAGPCPARDPGAPGAFDVVLAADVLYDREPAAAILSWLRALAANGATVLLSDPGRGHVPSDLVPSAILDAPGDVDVGDRLSRRAAVYVLGEATAGV